MTIQPGGISQPLDGQRPAATDTTADRTALLDLLMARSFRYSEAVFTLSSGRESHYYVDCKPTTLDAHGSVLCGRLLFNMLAGRGFDGIGGLTLGADPLISAVTLTSSLLGEPMAGAIVRKEAKGHGTRKWVEGAAIPGQRLAVVDDVVTTGGSTVVAIERLRDAGFVVDGAVALVDRNEGGREAIAAAGLELTALYTMDDILARFRRES